MLRGGHKMSFLLLGNCILLSFLSELTLAICVFCSQNCCCEKCWGREGVEEANSNDGDGLGKLG